MKSIQSRHRAAQRMNKRGLNNVNVRKLRGDDVADADSRRQCSYSVLLAAANMARVLLHATHANEIHTLFTAALLTHGYARA
jgi:hypothetical protein